MRAGRLFVLLAVAAVGAISIWQVSDDEGRRMLVAASHNSPQQQNRERHDQQAALCRKYSKATPLTVKLEGRTLAVQGQGRASQIASQIRQALPGARVFVDGKLEERAGYDVPQYVREAPPDDAVVLRVSERQLPEDEPKNAFTTIHEITVLDSAGAVNGRWQGFLNGCPSSSPQDPLSLVAFLASQPAGMSAPLPKHPQWQEVQFDVLTAKGRRVARPEDFIVPVSSPRCRAALVKQANARDPALQVTTAVGVVSFRYVKADQTLPAVACSDDRIALIFRTPTHVAVMALDGEGYLYAVGRVALKKATEREAFREVAIENGKLHATLVAFELARNGTLAAEEGRSIVATLGPTPQMLRTVSTPESLGLTLHESCAPPPALPPSTEVHEMSGLRASWEYVQLPGQQPVPFSNVIVDAPLRSVAVSFPGALVDMVWLIQATTGTDLRYVEISSKSPQTVLFKNPGNAVVNVATDPSCLTLFFRGSPSRRHYNIRSAYSKRGEREAIGLVLLANGNPFVSAAATHRALEAFDFKHLSSLTSYYLQLKAEGAIEEATAEDIRRFREYYYDGMPLRRKIVSWFRQDPALDIPTGRLVRAYVAKRRFALPKYPDDTVRETPLFVDKGVPLPQGDVKDYLILDANTLSCPGRQRGCPWTRERLSR